MSMKSLYLAIIKINENFCVLYQLLERFNSVKDSICVTVDSTCLVTLVRFSLHLGLGVSVKNDHEALTSSSN